MALAGTCLWIVFRRVDPSSFLQVLSVESIGAYARLRKQFRVPITEMEGVQEALTRSWFRGVYSNVGADAH